MGEYIKSFKGNADNDRYIPGAGRTDTYPLVSISISIPSTEDGRDYDLDSLMDFKGRHGQMVNPERVADVIFKALEAAGYSEVQA